jgi:hypothetical protein
MQSVPSLALLRGLMAKQKRANEDLMNYVKDNLKPGLQVIYRRMGESASFSARVVEVTGVPARIRVLVEKINTGKRIGIALEDITGIVQED